MERMLVALTVLAQISQVLMTGVASAGTVLKTPEQLNPESPSEGYPESRFGRPPVKPEPGINAHFASKAVEEMEAPAEGMPETYSSRESRSPAGLNFSDQGQRPRPVQQQQRAARLSPETGESSTGTSPLGGGLSTAVHRRGIQEVSLIAGDLGYFPKTLFVVRDIPVRIFVTGASKNTLCIMMDSFQVRKQVRSQKIEEITFTPSLPGKYRFYCPVNGMEGTLIVKELASAQGLSE